MGEDHPESHDRVVCHLLYVILGLNVVGSLILAMAMLLDPHVARLWHPVLTWSMLCYVIGFPILTIILALVGIRRLHTDHRRC